MRMGSAIRSPQTPSTLQACSFFSNPFMEFCFSTPSFSSFILFHKLSKDLTLWKFQYIVLEPEILWKSCFAWAFSKHIFLFYAIFNFHMYTCHWACVRQSWLFLAKLSHTENREEASQKNEADETGQRGHRVTWPLLKGSVSPLGLFSPSHGSDCL